MIYFTNSAFVFGIKKPNNTLEATMTTNNATIIVIPAYAADCKIDLFAKYVFNVGTMFVTFNTISEINPMIKFKTIKINTFIPITYLHTIYFCGVQNAEKKAPASVAMLFAAVSKNIKNKINSQSCIFFLFLKVFLANQNWTFFLSFFFWPKKLLK